MSEKIPDWTKSKKPIFLTEKILSAEEIKEITAKGLDIVNPKTRTRIRAMTPEEIKEEYGQNERREETG